MEINNLEDLGIIKDALENYRDETKNLLENVKIKELTEIIHEKIQKCVIRADELVNEVEEEIDRKIKAIAKQKIDNGDVIEFRRGNKD